MRQGTGTNRPKTYTQTRNHTHPRMPNKHSHPTTNNTSPTHQKGGTPTECTKLRRLIAAGKRPDPSRTRKLSLPAPMILPNPGGKVGHRRTQIRITPHAMWGVILFVPQHNSVEERRNSRLAHFLQCEQRAFAIQSAAISRQAAVRPDHPMARHDDADWVVAVGQSDRTRCCR